MTRTQYGGLHNEGVKPAIYSRGLKKSDNDKKSCDLLIFPFKTRSIEYLSIGNVGGHREHDPNKIKQVTV